MSAMTLPAKLDQLTAEQLRALVLQQAAIMTRHDRELHWRQTKIDKLTHEVAYYKRHYFGVKAERLPVEQGQLFEETLAADMAAITEELAQLSSKPKGQAKRKPLPPELPRTEVHHEPESTTCPCGCQMKRIGEDIAEKLDYTPGTFTVERHIRGKWACAQCETLVQAPVPAHVIDKGIPTTGLLAHVLIAKYLDHLPLYRLERIFERQEVHIARSTMCAWMAAAAQLVGPLVALMASRVKQSRVIHTDDTTVPIQSPGEKQCRKGRIWTYLGDRSHPYIVYQYTPNRSRAGPAGWLAGFTGYLQADAYGGYDGIYAHGGVTEVACWAHARRKFFEAKETDSKRAAAMLTMIRELYAVEDEAKLLDDAARRALRQQNSAPLLARIKIWLDAEQEVVLPRSEMGQAITYALNQWDALCVYATQGVLNIDNNASERALKRVALGRKNWLFAGHDAAAENHARLWSLIASCERHGVDPQRYLTSVLAKLPFTPEHELDQFLPDVWKCDDDATSTPTTG